MVRPHGRGRTVEVGHRDTRAAELDDLVLAQLDRGPRVGDERGHVRGEEVLALSDAHHQGRVPARADHHVRFVGVHGDQGEGAFQPPAHLPHGLREIAGRREPLRQQVCHDLGVRLGLQPVSALGQLGAERGEVLDDAVVHDGHAPRVVEVRVGVGVGGPAVGRPPGVPEPRGTGRQRMPDQLLLQIDELPGLLDGRQAAVREHGDPGRVVAAVLQPLESGDDHIERRLRSHVTHNSAHRPQRTP